MKKISIIADNKIPFLKGAFENVADIQYFSGNDIDHNVVKNADALIVRTRTKCNEQLLKGSSVKFIASATIGYDHIDTEFCDNAGILWTNAPGCNSSSVEQYMIAALLALGKKHKFKLKDKTIGIVGVGNVGQKVSCVAKALGMKVIHNDPPRQRAEGSDRFHSISEIKEVSDIVTFHVPLNPAGEYRTIGLADKKFLDSLRQGVIIINTSRGEVLDENALKDALVSQRIKDAVLDVWHNEPGIDKELVELSGIATPHIAGYSIDGKAKGTEMSVHSVSRFFNLGLEKWNPRELPGNDINQVVIDCGGMDEQEIISEVYLKTYDISKDDKALRRNIKSFEDLRGNYPVRREPSYYTVRLNNNPYEYIEDILESLRFSLLELNCFC